MVKRRLYQGICGPTKESRLDAGATIVALAQLGADITCSNRRDGDRSASRKGARPLEQAGLYTFSDGQLLDSRRNSAKGPGESHLLSSFRRSISARGLAVQICVLCRKQLAVYNAIRRLRLLTPQTPFEQILDMRQVRSLGCLDFRSAT